MFDEKSLVSREYTASQIKICMDLPSTFFLNSIFKTFEKSCFKFLSFMTQKTFFLRQLLKKNLIYHNYLSLHIFLITIGVNDLVFLVVFVLQFHLLL